MAGSSCKYGDESSGSGATETVELHQQFCSREPKFH
jgi:hypothetical protein